MCSKLSLFSTCPHTILTTPLPPPQEVSCTTTPVILRRKCGLGKNPLSEKQVPLAERAKIADRSIRHKQRRGPALPPPEHSRQGALFKQEVPVVHCCLGLSLSIDVLKAICGFKASASVSPNVDSLTGPSASTTEIVTLVNLSSVRRKVAGQTQGGGWGLPQQLLSLSSSCLIWTSPPHLLLDSNSEGCRPNRVTQDFCLTHRMEPRKPFLFAL